MGYEVIRDDVVGGGTFDTVTVEKTINVVDDATFDGGTLFVDADQNNVGINTTTPGAQLDIHDKTTGSANTGGRLRLSADDGAPMGDSHRLGVIEFSGAEDSSGTQVVGARMEALTDAAWTNAENGTALYFYTTDGNASQHNVLKLDSNEKATFSGNVDISGGLQFDGGTAVTSIDADISSVSGSDDTLASAKAIKTYVDSVAGGGGGAVSAVANGSNNRIATFSSSDALNGEANLEFDGTDLSIAAAGKIEFRDTGIYAQSDEDGHLAIVSDGHVTTSGFPSNENNIGTSATSLPSIYAHAGDATGEKIGYLTTTGGDALTVGLMYYLSDDPGWHATSAVDADEGAGDLIAIALNTNAAANGGSMLLRGLIRLDSGDYVGTAAVGKTAYMSEGTTGKIDFDKPATSGNIVRVVGHCVQKDGSNHILFYFNPSNDYVEIA